MQFESYPCRTVTDDEVVHYREFGWAKLEGFVHPEIVGTLIRLARERMGEDGDSNPPLPISIGFFNHEPAGGLTDPELRPLLDKVGRSAKTLMGRRPGIEARYYTDYFAVKLPAGKKTRHWGNLQTDFHQDFPNWGVDRSGGMAFWIALTDLRPEQGTMSFVNGSHRMGALGNYHCGDVLDDFPELREQCSISGPVWYKAGDATVHSNMIAHGAGPNLGATPRWAYSILVNPSDVRWNGAPAEGFDTAGMKLLQPIDDERFALLK